MFPSDLSYFKIDCLKRHGVKDMVIIKEDMDYYCYLLGEKPNSNKPVALAIGFSHCGDNDIFNFSKKYGRDLAITRAYDALIHKKYETVIVKKKSSKIINEVLKKIIVVEKVICCTNARIISRHISLVEKFYKG